MEMKWHLNKNSREIKKMTMMNSSIKIKIKKIIRKKVSLPAKNQKRKRNDLLMYVTVGITDLAHSYLNS